MGLAETPRTECLPEAGILSFSGPLTPDSAGDAESASGRPQASLKAWRVGRGYAPQHFKQLSEAPSRLRENGRDEIHFGWDVWPGFEDLSEAVFVQLNM